MRILNLLQARCLHKSWLTRAGLLEVGHDDCLSFRLDTLWVAEMVPPPAPPNDCRSENDVLDTSTQEVQGAGFLPFFEASNLGTKSGVLDEQRAVLLGMLQ